MNADRLTNWIFLRINKGETVEPRRLKFVKSLDIVKPKILSTWLDIGAGNGNYLNFMPDNSFGLDIKENLAKKVLKWNFNDPIPNNLVGKIDVIWCSNLIEHVLRPHEFLIKIQKFLKPDGLLVVCCPQTLIRNPLIFRGTLHGDHVNFFNLTTLKLTIKYAGYKVCFSGSPSFKKLGSRLSFMSPMIMVIAKKKQNFQYPDSAHKILDSNLNIIWKDENLGH